MNIYQTQADQYQNSFSGQPNMSYYGAGWGMDPNLMTPAYSAPYRPQFLGDNPYAPLQEPGYGRSLGTLANPFYSPPMWQNSSEAYQPYADRVGNTGTDRFMQGMQRIFVPAAVYWGMDRMLSPGAAKGSGIWGSMKHPFQAKTAAGQFGKGFAQGLASPFLGQGGRAMAAIGGVGSAIGSFALPYAATEAALWGADKLAFSPYANTRRTANQLQENFANVTFSDAQGRDLTGRGLSGFEAGKYGSEIAKQGILDAHFSTSEYTDLANLSAKSGLLDSSKASSLAKNIKDISEQVKLIISISKDPSVEGAIEELYKLSSGGASHKGGRFSAASGAYTQIGSAAAQAGASVQKVMSTVGQQGQMLYQMNGLTPYLGQIAAANTYAGFAAAKRTGVLSTSALARMGGVEGATQSAVAGQVAAVQTPYAQMAAYNQYFGGASGSSVAGSNQNVNSTVSQFGALSSLDPLTAQGRLGLYGPALASRLSEDQGSDVGVDQAISILKQIHAKPAGANGQWDAAQIYQTLTGSMGITPDQARAMVSAYAADYDPETRRTRQKAAAGFARDQALNYADQYGYNNSVIGGAVNAVARAGRRFTADKSSGARGLAAKVQGVGEAILQGANRVWYGNTVERVDTSAVSADELVSSGLFTVSRREDERSKRSVDEGAGAGKEHLDATFKGYDTSVFGALDIALASDNTGLRGYSREMKDVLGSINDILKDPSHAAFRDAAAFRTAKGRDAQVKALRSLMKSAPGAFKSDAFRNKLLGDKSTLLDPFLKLQEVAATKDIRIDRDKVVSTEDRVKKVSGSGMSISDTVSAHSVAMKIGKAGVDSENVKDYIATELSSAEQKAIQGLISGKSGAEIIEALTGIAQRAGSQGVGALMTLAEKSLASFENGSRRFTSASAQEKFKKAGDRNSKLTAVMEELTSQNKELASTKINMKGANLSALAAVNESTVQAQSKLMGASNVDIKSFQETSKSLDVPGFNKAVGDFAKAVSAFTGKPNTSSQTTISGQEESSKGPGLYERLSTFQNNLRAQSR